MKERPGAGPTGWAPGPSVPRPACGRVGWVTTAGARGTVEVPGLSGGGRRRRAGGRRRRRPGSPAAVLRNPAGSLLARSRSLLGRVPPRARGGGDPGICGLAPSNSCRFSFPESPGYSPGNRIAMLALAQVKTAATILPRRVSLATILMPAVLSRAIKSWIRRESPVSLRTCSHEGPRPRPPPVHPGPVRRIRHDRPLCGTCRGSGPVTSPRAPGTRLRLP